MSKAAVKGTAPSKTDDKADEAARRKAQIAAEKAKNRPVKAITTVKKEALSIDVGPAVIAGLSKTYDDEAKARELIEGIQGKRYDLLSNTTMAIVKAATADDTINLAASVSGDVKAMNLLNDQLGLALGFREVIVEKDAAGNEHARIGYAKAVAKFFPQAKDDKKLPAVIRKATLRSNFLHLLKKCAQGALAIMEKDITATVDKVTGTLQVTGPDIKRVFGQETVLLNEKQTVGEGEAQVKLTEKPSFTALAKIGAEAKGKTLITRPQSGVASNAVDPDTALQSICNSLVAAISKLGGNKPSPKTLENFAAVKSAIDKVTPKG